MAIQRIFLDPETAGYVRKVMLGTPLTGAWRGREGGTALAIAEGFETAGAFTRLNDISCWASLGDRVAEVTGRTKCLISAGDGRQRLETRSTRTSQAEAAAFMEGRKRMLVFSDAGGTGRSYHASRDAANQEQRVHLLLEPGWRADRAIQGLGRTHRTHQASTPVVPAPHHGLQRRAPLHQHDSAPA